METPSGMSSSTMAKEPGLALVTPLTLTKTTNRKCIVIDGAFVIPASPAMAFDSQTRSQSMTKVRAFKRRSIFRRLKKALGMRVPLSVQRQDISWPLNEKNRVYTLLKARHGPALENTTALQEKGTLTELEQLSMSASRSGKSRLPSNSSDALFSHPVLLPAITVNTPDSDTHTISAAAPARKDDYRLRPEHVWISELNNERRRCRALETDLTAALSKAKEFEEQALVLRGQVADRDAEIVAASKRLNREADVRNALDQEIFQLRREIYSSQNLDTAPNSRCRRRSMGDSKLGESFGAIATRLLHSEKKLYLLRKESITHAVNAGYQRKQAARFRKLFNDLVTRNEAMRCTFQEQVKDLEEWVRRLQGIHSQRLPRNFDISGRSTTPEDLEERPEDTATHSLLISALESKHLLLRRLSSSEPLAVGDIADYRLDSPLQDSGQMAKHRQQRAPDTDSDNEDHFIANSFFRFGTHRVENMPAVPRVGILPMKVKSTENQKDVLPRLSLWEWSSVPDLRLLDPRLDCQ